MISVDNLKKIQNGLESDEALLILSPSNRFYLTGFESTDGFAFVTRSNRIFVTDFRYIEAAKNQISSFDVLIQSGKMILMISKIAQELKINKINLEQEYVNIGLFEALKSSSKAHFIADGRFDKEIRKMRSVKTEEEVSRISTAAKISEEALKRTLTEIKVGISEREVAAILEYQMRICGGDGVSFDTIAISGFNTAKPHGVPTDNVIKKGDFLTVDFGAKYKGYCSDMTRTFAIGNPSDEMKAVYSTVLAAQSASLERIKAGEICSDIDKIAREIIDKEYKGCFGHGLGHSVGIEIHETPTFSPSCNTVLSKNTVITCEPGIYLEGRFGVRIEDLVLVTEDGYNNLNSFDKNLIII